MTESGFTYYWNKEYPESFPINHELKWNYPDRWFRIHSLPESKRYADNDSEYQIIFKRQNQLMTDLIGDESEIFISFSLYAGDDLINAHYKELKDFGEFEKVATIDLKKQRPYEHEEELFIDVFSKTEIWKSNNRNDIIRAIADDEIRAMFISVSNKCIVAPYDGGVDVIVESTEKRDRLKNKYRNWLSTREDGM